MTSTILHSLNPQMMLHPGRCYVCFKIAEAPVLISYNVDFKDKVKICSDACLKKYREIDESFQKKIREHEENKKKNTLAVPKPSRKMENARIHLVALSTKDFNKDDMKVEDIEDLDLNKS